MTTPRYLYQLQPGQRATILHVGGPDNGVCATCGAHGQCHLLAARGARYVLDPAVTRSNVV